MIDAPIDNHATNKTANAPGGYVNQIIIHKNNATNDGSFHGDCSSRPRCVTWLLHFFINA